MDISNAIFLSRKLFKRLWRKKTNTVFLKFKILLLKNSKKKLFLEKVLDKKNYNLCLIQHNLYLYREVRINNSIFLPPTHFIAHIYLKVLKTD